MIAISANFEEVNIISLLYFNTDFRERFDHTVGQYFPSILYWAYDVIQQAGFVVALAYMAVFHAANIHPISLPSQQAARQSFLVYSYRERVGEKYSISAPLFGAFTPQAS